MIQANELRIGNWVSNGKRNFTVDANVIYDAANDLGHYSSNLYPIPLTHDILLKCGFKEVFKDKFKNDFYIMVVNIDQEKGSYAFGTDTYDGYLTDIKHLHQLQNLYFALTNQELNIQL